MKTQVITIGEQQADNTYTVDLYFDDGRLSGGRRGRNPGRSLLRALTRSIRQRSRHAPWRESVVHSCKALIRGVRRIPMRDDVFDRVWSLKLWRRSVGFAVLASVAGGIAPSAAPATVILSAPRPVLRIETGKPEGVGEIIIQANTKGDGDLPEGPPIVTDEGPQVPPAPPAAGTQPPPAPAVVFNEAIEIPVGDPLRRQWRVRATLTNFPTAGTTMARKLRIMWGAFATSSPVLYWASNAAIPAMTWKVAGLPAEWSANGSWCIPLRIAVSGQRATGIRLTSTLVEQTTKKPMASRLYLAVDEQRADGEALETAVNETQKPIALCADGSDASPGKYQGILNLSAAEKPEGDPVSVTLLTTTTRAIWLGIVALALGCGLAYVLRVLAPARLLRSQALLPAAVIRERAAALKKTLNDALKQQPAVMVARVPAALDELIGDLLDTVLENQNLVPRRIPSPFGTAVDTAKYKALLDSSSATLARLDVLVNEGLVEALRLGGPTLPTVVKAIDDLMLIDPPPSIPALQTRVAAELVPLKPAPRAGAAEPLPPPLTTETLTFQIDQTSQLLWIGSVLLSFVIGLFVLILNNPAFGVPVDFLYCFLWGFGIPAVASQLTATSAGTALGVTLPKTTP